ncbi:MAG TPA: hypothetical protein VMZ53_22390 [Kofleriaceae bacterium]|nr:hypothetical protein [Kofleriaceae bacterium]
MRRLVLLFVLVAGCEGGPRKEAAPIPPPKLATRVELTAVTLADDCGGAPPASPPVKTERAETATKAKSKADSATFEGARMRRCEQTSMQLTIIAAEGSKIQVSSVELFDDKGTSLGTLTASRPTRWSDASGTYEAWDESVTAGSTTSVSYVLTQPKWDHIGDRWNKTYTVKTVLSVGGVTQAAERNVTLTAPTSLPPNVKT